jgi:hypothetical protein
MKTPQANFNPAACWGVSDLKGKPPANLISTSQEMNLTGKPPSKSVIV